MKRHFKQVMLARWLDYRGEESRQVLLWAFLNARFQTGLRNLLDGAILETGEPRRSEERRVGKECRTRWSAYDVKKKTVKRRRKYNVLQGAE